MESICTFAKSQNLMLETVKLQSLTSAQTSDIFDQAYLGFRKSLRKNPAPNLADDDARIGDTTCATVYNLISSCAGTAGKKKKPAGKMAVDDLEEDEDVEEEDA